MTVCISHKKMSLIKDELSKVINETEKEEQLYKFLAELLKYDENKTYTYDKEKYEKYTKPYYEKNKEKLNKAKSEKRRQKKIEEKDIISIEKSLNII
jgi:TPP-dependent 2-oxoacid decarboxylase